MVSSKGNLACAHENHSLVQPEEAIGHSFEKQASAVDSCAVADKLSTVFLVPLMLAIGRAQCYCFFQLLLVGAGAGGLVAVLILLKEAVFITQVLLNAAWLS